MKRAALLSLLLLSTSAGAQEGTVYRWTDEKGELHYTNDPDTIPKRFRERAKSTQGAELQTLRTERPATVERRPESSPPSSEVNESGSPTTEEGQWRARFSKVHGQVEKLEADLAKDREAAQETEYTPSGLRSTDAALDAEDRARESAAKLEDAKARLQELERAAREEGVPFEWRKAADPEP